MKYLNALIFLLLGLVYLSLSSQIKFSTNFLDIFLSQKSIKLFDVAKKLGATQDILIAKKGFNKDSLNELYEIQKELKKLPMISKAEVKKSLSKPMRDYLIQNYYILSDFNSSVIPDKIIKKKLQGIYDKIYSSPFYEPINTYDPLELFKQDTDLSSKYVKLKDYGYVLKAQTSVDTSSASEARKVYTQINKIAQNHSDVIAIAPFFYLVENSAYIKSDAQKIMLISTILLLILYFFILKNYKLFFNTMFTIGSSILSAILVTFYLFGSINILALVFGVSITTISIDYMFHYYFHGDFSSQKFIMKKRVFFGFLTTFGVFLIFSFVDITLFSQLAVFSAISLSVAYLLFSWLFIYLDISLPNVKTKVKKIKSFKPLHVALISLLMLGYAYKNLEFDNNLKNLDYQNKKLMNISKKFNTGLSNKSYKKVLINAKTQELLLQQYEELLKKHPTMLGVGKFVYSDKKCKLKRKKLKEYDFETLVSKINIYAKQIGFKNAFTDAYKGVQNIGCKMDILEAMGFRIIKDEGVYYTVALINPKDNLEKSLHVEIVDLGKTLLSDMNDMKTKLVTYMGLSTAFIIILLFFIAGKNILFPMMYLLFPLSSVLFAISLLGKINIMHIFALVILLAISIDYGIYMHKTTSLSKTKIAIKYALLSTFCGFGVLIFSSTVALYSIGFVISIGIGAIFLLLYTSL